MVGAFSLLRCHQRRRLIAEDSGYTKVYYLPPRRLCCGRGADVLRCVGRICGMVSAFCGGVSNNRRWKGDRYIDNRSRRSICKTAVNGVVVVRFPTEAGPAFVRTSAGFDEPTTAETEQGIQATLNSIPLPLLNSTSLFPWPPACLVDGPDAPRRNGTIPR